MNMFCLLLVVNPFKMLKIDSTASASMPESMYSSRIKMFELMLLR